ncbi:general transcription factor II-I repeat domain-containing protein 2-like [Palaemon carinicauda]|uniref:general transcription factor II-I repeat domain-containing protein 2-like n=1 Tax=Palaemon carinicauda TaxID=392227 RepID=UPI0035B6647A
MVDAVSVVCPEVISKVEAISLSRRTIVRRIDAIAMNIQDQMLTASVSFHWFSIALDESNDIQDTAQVFIYIRGIDENFEITEELLSMESLKDTVTGKDLYNSVINSLIRSRLSLDKLASITTDGAPSLIALSDKYSYQLTALRDEFIRRFADFKAIEGQFNLLSSPFACDVETAAEELQVELIDLQADNSLKRLFENKPLVEFYASLHSEKFINLKNFARKMFVIFASTYICEQTFSILKVNKSKNRSLLTDSNLQSVLRISTSNLTPNFNKLVNDCSQLHHAH